MSTGIDNTNNAKIDTQALAVEVLKEYGIIPENLALIQGGSIKTVWKLAAKKNRYCLKRLKQTYDKALFSVNAQIHIKNSGGKVPGVILNIHGRPITEYNGQLFVLYEWIDGNDLNFSNPADLKLAVQGLADFHVSTRDYVPDLQSRISTKLGRWPEQYASMRDRMAGWKEISLKKSALSCHASYLTYIEPVVSMANHAIDLLARSQYMALTGEGSRSIVLCHQDYGKGNALHANDGIYVLDLDGVTFDLPARDLRKIIGKNAENTGKWSPETILRILGWYTEKNPLNKDEIEVLFIDMIFPHWFFGLVKNLFQKGKPLKPSEIERIGRLEISKEKVLEKLLERSEQL
ncbi:MAG: CotS family spore coat protein [Acetivibrionales bacterium]